MPKKKRKGKEPPLGARFGSPELPWDPPLAPRDGPEGSPFSTGHCPVEIRCLREGPRSLPGTLFWLSCLLPGLFLGSFGCLWCSNRPSKWASERTANCKRRSIRTSERTTLCSCAACPLNVTVDGYRQEQASSIYITNSQSTALRGN